LPLSGHPSLPQRALQGDRLARQPGDRARRSRPVGGIVLQLGTGMQTIDGITVFPDDQDEGQKWYLPAPVRIARRVEDGHPLFSLIKYRPAAADAGVQGGGFAMFTVALGLTEKQERRLRGKLGADVRLSAVPFDEGTVECVALNLQGPGGT